MTLLYDGSRSNHTVVAEYRVRNESILLHHRSATQNHTVSNSSRPSNAYIIFAIDVPARMNRTGARFLEFGQVRNHGVHPAADDVATNRMVCTSILDARSILFLL